MLLFFLVKLKKLILFLLNLGFSWKMVYFTSTDKIVNRLDYDWGAEFKFYINFNASGSITTSLSDFNNPSIRSFRKAFSLSDLTEFEGISIDFVGATRMGNRWKGSKIIYNK